MMSNIITLIVGLILMIKMERTCGSMRARVMYQGQEIGSMEGVYVTQWFVKNKYRFTGTFTRFLTKDPHHRRCGIVVDVIFPDKGILIKESKIDWIKEPTGSGTFTAKGIESHI